jgi:hypothetical protein
MKMEKNLKEVSTCYSLLCLADVVCYFIFRIVVNRLHCKGSTFDADMVLDVNAELFDPKGGDRIAVVLASSLGANADDGHFNPKYNVSLSLFLFGCNFY